MLKTTFRALNTRTLPPRELAASRIALIRHGGVYPGNLAAIPKVHQGFLHCMESLHTSNTLHRIVYERDVMPLLTTLPSEPLGWPETFKEQSRLFAHLFSGSYVKGSKLEGSSTEAISKYLEAWFSYIIKNTHSTEAFVFLNKIIPHLQSLQEQEKWLHQLRSRSPSLETIRTAATEQMLKVLNMPIGESYLMIGGWRDHPEGHAMLYEFTRKNTNQFDFRVINTGAGTEYHPSLLEGTKEKIAPLIAFPDLHSKDLHVFFFQALLEPLVLAYWNLSGPQTRKTEMDIALYRQFALLPAAPNRQDANLFPFLSKEIAETYACKSLIKGLTPSAPTQEFITRQRAGTCACDSIMAYLRYRAGFHNLALFEQIRFTLRRGLLQQAWHSWKDLIKTNYSMEENGTYRTEMTMSEILSSLLEGGTKLLLSDSVKPIFLKNMKPWFSKTEASSAQEMALEIQKEIETLKCERRQKACVNSPVLELVSKPLIPNTEAKEFLKEFSKYKIPEFGLTVRPYIPIVGIQNLPLKPEQCRLFLAAHVEQLNKYMPYYYWNEKETQAQIQWISEALPIPTFDKDDFWQKIPESEIGSIMETIDFLAETYHTSCKNDHPAIPEERNVLYTFLTLQHTLSLRVEMLKKEPSPCPLHWYQIFPPTKNEEEDPYLAFFTPSALQRRQEILNYFHAYNTGRGNAEVLHNFEENYAAISIDHLRSSLRKRSDFLYYLRWTESDPDSIQKLSDKLDINSSDDLVFLKRLTRDEKLAWTFMHDPYAFFIHLKQPHLAALHRAAFLAYFIPHVENYKPERGKRFNISHKLNRMTNTYSFQFWYAKRASVQNGEYADSERLHAFETDTLKKGSSLFRRGDEFHLNPLRPQKLQTEVKSLPSLSIRTTVKPLATPLTILDWAAHNIHAFTDRITQEEFRISLLKSVLLDPHSETLTFPFQILCQQSSFRERCAAFIREGIKYFWENQTKSTRKLDPILYFIRLAGQISHWMPQTQDLPEEFHPKTQLKWIANILKEEGFSEKEKQAIHLHRILIYEKTLSSDLDAKDIQNLLQSWFRANLYDFSYDHSINPYSVYQARQVIWKALPSITQRIVNSTEFCQQIGEILSPNHEIYKWEYDPLGKMIYEPNGLSLELRMGKIRHKGTNLEFRYTPPEYRKPTDAIWKHLFGGRTHHRYEYRYIEGYTLYSFTDPIWGSITISSTYAGEKATILRKNQDGNLYAFCPLSEKKSGNLSSIIPVGIRHRTVLWIPLSSSPNRESPSLLCDANTGKVLYQFRISEGLTENGSLTLASPPKTFAKIETETGILAWNHGQNNELSHIEYPFYISKGKNPLHFDVVSHTATREKIGVWRENPDYRLAPIQTQGLLGTFTKYLVLEHLQTKKQKLIVIFTILEKTNPLSSLPTFERDLKFSDFLGFDTPPNLTYVALDLVDGKPKANRPEENLYLSYLYLQQRDYKTAFHYAKEIPAKNRFSKDLWEESLWPIMEWIFKSNDYSMEGCSICLHLLSLAREEMRHPNHFFEINKRVALVQKYYKKYYLCYLENANHGPSFLEPPFLPNAKSVDALFTYSTETGTFQSALPIESPSYRLGKPFPKVSPFYGHSVVSPYANLNKSKRPFPDIFISSETPTFGAEFYIWYRWIIEGDTDTRDYLYHVLLSSHENNYNIYFDRLKQACLVIDPSQLPPPLTVEENEKDAQSYFAQVVNAIDTAPKRAPPMQEAKQAPRKTPYSKSLVDPLKTAAIAHFATGCNRTGPIPLKKALPSTELYSIKYFTQKTRKKTRSIQDLAGKEILPEWEEFVKTGQNRRNGEKHYILRKEADLNILRLILSTSLQEQQEKMDALEEQILLKFYPAPETKNDIQKENAAILSRHYPFKHSISSLIGLFLEGTYEAFAKANPNLTKEEIDAINHDLQKFLVQGTQAQLFRRVIEKIESATDEASFDDVRKELDTRRSYDTTWRAGLVFEYVSNKRLRPQQAVYLAKIIERMESDHPYLLTHMTMGGGKTDVFASLLGRLFAKPGKISLFLTPESQIKTVLGNLSSSQWTHFRQEICTFDYTRQELSQDVLDYIYRELILARDEQKLVILKSEMPQILELEWACLACLRQASQNTRLQTLTRILRLFQTETTALIDETDEVLRVDRETNFPSGEKIFLEKQRIHLIADIYQILASDPYFTSVFQIEKKEQEALSQEKYESMIRPYLAQLLADNIRQLTIPSSYKKSFVRYLTGAIDPKLEIEKERQKTPPSEDAAFLAWREELFQKDPESAHHLALARHLLQDILPFTLRKKTNREYGRQNGSSGKVVPYIAAGIPSSNEFGHPWEVVAYHFQTALTTKLTPEQLETLVKALLLVAKQETVYLQIALKETPTFRNFQTAFDLDLSELDTPQKLTEAIDAIHSDTRKKIAIEEYFIAQEVTFDPNYYSSNGHNLMMFPKTMIMTGTPYNRKSYPIRFSQDPLLDFGAEGALTDLLIERNGEIHVMNNPDDLNATISQILHSSEHKEKIRALIDIGGILADKKNDLYAQNILDCFADNPTVQGVVFFRTTPKNGNYLALLKKGSPVLIDLPNTHRETWKALGIDPNTLFFFYDQWRSRGTDLPLPPDAVAIAMLGNEDPIHKILQGVARLRKLSSGQDVIYAISQTTAASIPKEELSAETLLKQSFRKEKELLQTHIFRHYIQEIHDVLRSAHIREQILLNPDSPILGDKSILMTNNLYSPFEQFGKLPSSVPPLEIIEAYANKILEKSVTYIAIRPQIKRIVLDARKHLQDLPDFIESNCHSLGREQEVQIQVQQTQEIQVENTQELQTELEKEWNSYQDAPKSVEKTETPWTFPDADFLASQNSKSLQIPSERGKSLQEILSDFSYQHPFPSLFSENLFATKNWHNAFLTPLSIFNAHHKPAKQLLVIEHGPADQKMISGLLISLEESEFFRLEYLPKQDKDIRMWLVDAEGRELSQNPMPVNRETERLLIQMNLLNGHADWIAKHLALSLPWIYEDPKLAKWKLHFLHLQAHRDKNPQKIAVLLANPWLRHNPNGLEALVEENLDKITKDLLPLVPLKLTTHKNFPVALIPLNK